MTALLVAGKPMKKRDEVSVEPQLEKTLLAYEAASRGSATPLRSRLGTVAAIAAGLATMALPKLTDAEVIYTKVNQELPSPFGTLQIDLANNGIADVVLSVSASSHIGSGHHTFAGGVNAKGLNGGAIETSKGLVLADPIGTLIGSSDKFGSKGLLGACFYTSSVFSGHHTKRITGLWRSQGSRYMGVKFSIAGETHYGWVRLKGFSCSFLAPFLTGYAYESEPNKPIDSGATIPGDDAGTLGGLASGANGIQLWRKPTPGKQQPVSPDER